MKKNKMTSTLLSIMALGSIGCSYAPIIVEPITKVPLIEYGADSDSSMVLPLKRHAWLPFKNTHLEDSIKRQQSRRYLTAKRTEEKLKLLSLELELLALENDRIKRKTEFHQRYTAQRSEQNIHISTLSQKNTSIAYAISQHLKKTYSKVSEIKAEIDAELHQLESRSSKYPPKVAPPKVTSIVALQDQTQVDRPLMVEYERKKPRDEPVLFHTVYVFNDSKKWSEFWHALGGANVTDKWRGKNKIKNIHFIYVGAYGKQDFAVRRQKYLRERLGVAPSIVSAASKQLLASLTKLMNG